jgi:hypothetical protein
MTPCRRWRTRRMKALSPGAAAARGRRVLLLTRSPLPIQDAPNRDYNILASPQYYLNVGLL